MTYHKIKINRATIYISSDELNVLLMKDPQLFATCLKRGKAFERSNQLKARIEQKRLDEF